MTKEKRFVFTLITDDRFDKNTIKTMKELIQKTKKNAKKQNVRIEMDKKIRSLFFDGNEPSKQKRIDVLAYMSGTNNDVYRFVNEIQPQRLKITTIA